MGLTDHIALAVDFSDPSKLALRAAFELVQVCEAKRVTVLYAAKEVVLPQDRQAGLHKQLEKLKTGVQESAMRALEALVAETRPPACTVPELKVVHGQPARVIPLKAKELGATLLVVGTHARRGLSRMIMGSVAETMLRGLEIPALVTQADEDRRRPDREIGALTRILIAVDATHHARDVVETGLAAARAAKNVKPAVTLLSVTDVPSTLAPELATDPGAAADVAALRLEARRVATGQLAELAKDCDAGAIPIEFRISDGDAKEEILRVAEQIGARLIVIGTHGRGYAKQSDLGTTATEVVRNANAVVLLVPTAPGEHASGG